MKSTEKQYWKIDFPKNEVYSKLIEKKQMIIHTDCFFTSSKKLLIKDGVMSIRKGDCILSYSHNRTVSIYSVVDEPRITSKAPVEFIQEFGEDSCEGEYLVIKISLLKDDISIFDLKCEYLENSLRARYSIRNITRFADVIEKAISDKTVWTANSVLFEQLSRADNLADYIKKNKPVFYTNDPLLYLEKLKDEKHLTKAQIAKLSGQGNYVYKIFKGEKSPKRDVLICIGIGMGLSVDEIQKLLGLFKFAPLDPKDKRDVIIIFGLFRNLPIGITNDLLSEVGADTFFEN